MHFSWLDEFMSVFVFWAFRKLELLQGPLEHLRFDHGVGQHRGRSLDGVWGNYRYCIISCLVSHSVSVASLKFLRKKGRKEEWRVLCEYVLAELFFSNDKQI